MVDCGADWLELLDRIAPGAIVLTHAHPDHAAGLAHGSPCPVYATLESWRRIDRYPIGERVTVAHRAPFTLERLTLEAFPVAHSLRAPAVGYRIGGAQSAVFYAPDLVAIADEREALAGIDLYIGDGASVRRPIVRRRDGVPIGHAPIRAQLDWCAAAGVGRAIFTHCGSGIVRGEEAEVAAEVAELGRLRGVEAAIAQDGLVLELPRG
jgi:phosphoribosyl 1,2-cyclic phosphodiesterase